MARPPKTGLTYFPLDVDMDQDDKIFMIEAEVGEIAFGRIVKLLMSIYSDGYYKSWSEEDALVFAGKKKVPINEVINLVNVCVNRGLLHRKLYEKYKILTSAAIQRRFIKACERRNQVVLDSRYLLIDLSEFGESINSIVKIINGDKTGVNVTETPVKEMEIPENVALGTQRKGKERKEKEREPSLPNRKPRPDQEDFPDRALSLLEPYHDRAESFVAQNRQELIDLAARDGPEIVLEALRICVESRVGKLDYFLKDYPRYRQQYQKAKAESEKDLRATQKRIDELKVAEGDAKKNYDPGVSLKDMFNQQVIGNGQPRASTETDKEPGQPTEEVSHSVR